MYFINLNERAGAVDYVQSVLAGYRMIIWHGRIMVGRLVTFPPNLFQRAVSINPPLSRVVLSLSLA